MLFACCNDFGNEISLENHTLSLSRFGLDGSSLLFFIISTWWLLTGAKNWVAYGNITLFQPSEFMKFPSFYAVTFHCPDFFQRNKGRERLLRQDWFLTLELIIYTIPVFALLALSMFGNSLSILGHLVGLVPDFRSFLENNSGHLASSRWG